MARDFSSQGPRARVIGLKPFGLPRPWVLASFGELLVVRFSLLEGKFPLRLRGNQGTNRDKRVARSAINLIIFRLSPYVGNVSIVQINIDCSIVFVPAEVRILV